MSGKHPGGRPTKYRAEYVDQARKLCELGATDVELAAFFNVSIRSIYQWAAEHEAFSQALRVGKDAADERVKRALYAKATGYTYESEKIFCHEGVVIRVKTVEHVPPSDTAMIFWLKNRQRAEWRDRQEHEMSGTMQIVLPPEAAKL